MPQRFLVPLLRLACLIGGLLVLISCSSAVRTPAPDQPQAIPLKDCQLSSPGQAQRLPAKCGQLTVYEDRQAASGRQIQIHLAVIPAISRNPAPDPLFFFAGGPGQAATETYPQLSTAFDRLNQKRDIILVDQRGTGKSNPLVCSSGQLNEPDLSNTTDLTAWLQACLDHLEANPALYTTAPAMQDIDQVRAALGYDQINLYGVSYGTRAALTYLKLYPQHVRAMILDGVVPQDTALGQDVAKDAQRSLDLILARCASEAACQAAFPDARQDFSDSLGSLRASPVDVNLLDPNTGELTEMHFTVDQFASATRLLSYTPETAALLPLLFHAAQSRADFGLMAAQYQIVAGELDESIADGMNYSVLCAEDFPFIDQQAASRNNQGTYLGDQQTDQLRQICSVWPRGELLPGFKEPVSSDKPVLILSGETDPVTPPSNGDRVAQTLPNSLALVAPGQGHNVIYRGCLPKIAADFIESGSTQGLDTVCVASIKPMPFFVNFSGPMP